MFAIIRFIALLSFTFCPFVVYAFTHEYPEHALLTVLCSTLVMFFYGYKTLYGKQGG